MAFANRVFASSVALRAELRPQWGPWRKPEEEAGCLALVQQGLFSPSMTRQAWSSVLMHCRNAEMDSQQGGVPPRFTSRKESSWPSALGCRVGSCPGVCAVRGHKCCQLQRVTEESCLSSLLYCLGCVTDTLLSSVGAILRWSTTPRSIIGMTSSMALSPLSPPTARQSLLLPIAPGGTTSPSWSLSLARSHWGFRARPSFFLSVPRTFTGPPSTTAWVVPSVGLLPVCSWNSARKPARASSTARPSDLPLATL